MMATVKYIGDFNEEINSEATHTVCINKMTGRTYKPNKPGDAVDLVGEPDNRYMVYSQYVTTIPYKVYESKEDIKKNFELSGHNTSEVLDFFQ